MKPIVIEGAQTKPVVLKGISDVEVILKPGCVLRGPPHEGSYGIYIERCRNVRVHGAGTITGWYQAIRIAECVGALNNVVIEGDGPLSIVLTHLKQQGLLSVNTVGTVQRNLRIDHVDVQHAIYHGCVEGGKSGLHLIANCDLSLTGGGTLQYNGETGAEAIRGCVVKNTRIVNGAAVNLLSGGTSSDPIVFENCDIQGRFNADQAFGKHWPSFAKFTGTTKHTGHKNFLNGSKLIT